eukprot:6036421-Amphidinium_carterae.1
MSSQRVRTGFQNQLRFFKGPEEYHEGTCHGALEVDGMDSSASPQSHYDVMVPPPSPVHPAAKQQQPLSSRAFMEAAAKGETLPSDRSNRCPRLDSDNEIKLKMSYSPNKNYY